MKKLLLSIYCFLISLNSDAQTTELWGMTRGGGQYDAGTIFKTDGSGNNQIVQQSFFRCEGTHPFLSRLIQASDGKLYGMTSQGGANNYGVLFQYDPVNNTYTKKMDFAGTANGATPYSSLMEALDGKLYGMTSQGGANNLGIIFQYDPITNTFTKKIDFTGAISGSHPRGALMQASDGKLYGMTFNGGANDYGVLFQYDPTTNTFSKKIDFMGATNGANPKGSLMLGPDGKFYGLTQSGGANSGGVLFQYDYIINTYTKKFDFGAGTDGSSPNGSLMSATDGKLYGMTESGGTGLGVLFQYDPSTNTYAKKMDFSGVSNGSNPLGSLMQASDGKLYGMTQGGGVNNNGVLFQYDPATNTYNKKIDLAGTTNGSNPNGTLMEATDGKLYGMTYLGGVNDIGVLFQYDPVTNIFTKKIDFAGAPYGSDPYGTFMQASDGKLYGMTSFGGVNNLGVLFQYDPTTNTFTKKLDFAGIANGAWPSGSFIQTSDGKLYGMAWAGGINNLGVLFQYDPGANTFIKQLDFAGTTNGSAPYGSFIQGSDGKLYGMTVYGGANDKGVLFQYDPVTNAYIKKLDFAGTTNGANPYSSLVQASDGKLYGMTFQGGTNDKGILFQYDPATNIFSKQLDFDGTTNGSNPSGSLMQASDGKLYGMTFQGGTNDNGVLFQYDPTTNTFTKKIDFSGATNGANPFGSLMQASDGKLYGMTQGGGVNNNGVLFQYDPVTNNFTKQLDFNGTNGSRPLGNLIELGTTVGIREQQFNDNRLSIYPNPSNGNFSIESEKESKCVITNVLGEIITTQSLQKGKNEINLSKQSCGVYFVKNNSSIYKIIKN